MPTTSQPIELSERVEKLKTDNENIMRELVDARLQLENDSNQILMEVSPILVASL